MLRGPNQLTVAERELIAAYTSGLNQCQYCHGVHKASAEAFGVAPGLLQNLLDDIEASPVDAKMKPVLRYVRKLTPTPTRLTQADANAVFAAGWADDAFHYMVSTCAMFNYFNRVLEGHGIHTNARQHENAGRKLAEPGFLAPLDMIKDKLPPRTAS